MSKSGVPTSRAMSPHLVLPPILTNERDKIFLSNLNEFIKDELKKTDELSVEQRYIVFKDAFDKIIEHVSAYKPLLTAVKAEYEDCIETIQRGQREAFYLSGKIKAMASEPSTIHNYRKRGDELEEKIEVIQQDNERLHSELHDLRKLREAEATQAQEAQVQEVPDKQPRRDNRPIPGLTLQQSTDIKLLTKEREKLEKQYKELSISYRTRYSPKHVKDELKDHLSEKVIKRDQLIEHMELMKIRQQKLKIAVEAAESYIKMQPPHLSIGDAVCASLARANKENVQNEAPVPDGLFPITPAPTDDLDDPTREKEAEMMLEYIERFNELLEDHKYEEAAIHAANSPKGILRTPETLTRFKEMKDVSTRSGRTPLLAFCDALMSTVLAYGVRPSKYMSIECVHCALSENRLDLLSHWISQERLTMTEKLGDMIYANCKCKLACSCGCLALAQRVYMDTKLHVQAALCMVRQGRMSQTLSYCKMHLKMPEYMELVRLSPTRLLAMALYDADAIPLGCILTALLENAHQVVLYVVEDIHLKPSEESTSGLTPLRKAVSEDYMTSPEIWLDIVRMCQTNGYDEAGIELLTAVTVMSALRSARDNVRNIEMDKQAELIAAEAIAEAKAAEQNAEKPTKKAKKKSGKKTVSDIPLEETQDADEEKTFEDTS